MRFLFCMLLIALLPSIPVCAQAAGAETTHFEKDGLAFDLPAKWTVTNYSTDKVKHLVVSPARGPQQIIVITQDAFDSTCNPEAVSKKITDTLVANTASQIHSGTPLRSAIARSRIGETEVEGVQLHGLVNGTRVTSEIYSLRHRLRLISLVYLRADNDTQGESAWEVIRKTLTISPLVLGAAAPEKTEPQTGDAPGKLAAPVNSPALITGNVLNGKAVQLVQPQYPLIARQAHAAGTVGVQVIIDESGNVIAAHAVSGHPLLQATATAAARASKFSSTTLCGEPVRVTGIIRYNFVAQ